MSLNLARLSEIRQFPWRNCGAQRIEHGEYVDGFLCEGTGDGREDAEAGEDHPDDAEGHPADRALEGDGAHAGTNVEQLVDALEGAVHDDRAGGFGGDVAVLAEGDADVGGQEGGGKGCWTV